MSVDAQIVAKNGYCRVAYEIYSRFVYKFFNRTDCTYSLLELYIVQDSMDIVNGCLIAHFAVNKVFCTNVDPAE